MKHLFVMAAVMLSLALLPTESRAAGKPFKAGYNQWIGLGAVFVAQDKGFFKANGLEVELVAFSGPGDTLPPLIGGHLDIALTTADNIILVQTTNAASIKAVYLTDASAGADAVVAKKSIGSMKDLKGKKVAATIGQVNHLLLLVALEQAGLKESDVEIVNMNADDAGAAFVAGSLDAAVTWEPWVSKAMEGDGRVAFSSKDAPNLILDAMAITEKTAKERSADLVAFLKAVDAGVEFMKEKPEEANAIIAKWLNVTPSDVAAMLTGVTIYGLKDNAELFGESAKTAPVVPSLEKVNQFLKSHDVTKKSADVPAFLDGQYVRAAMGSK